jgi:hypothetical protein
MDDEAARTDPEGPTPAQRARQLAQGLQPLQSIAWSLIGIFDELKMIRQEMHRQARAGGGRRG